MMVNKLMAAVIGVGMMLGIAGCGLEDSLLKSEVEGLVKEHASKEELITKWYEVGECENFNVTAKGEKTVGTIDLKLKNRKTGKEEKLTYEFTYNENTGYIEAQIKDKEKALKIIMQGVGDGIREEVDDFNNKLNQATDELKNIFGK